MTFHLETAQETAVEIVAYLDPVCERIEVAGSVRRLSPEVKDIEIVCIPSSEPDLLGLAHGRTRYWYEKVHNLDIMGNVVIGNSGGKYMKTILPNNIPLDLFMVNADNWGLQLAIRTGPADYSHRVLARRWVVHGYVSREGVLWKDDEPTYIREEKDLFDLLGLAWVEPEDRRAP